MTENKIFIYDFPGGCIREKAPPFPKSTIAFDGYEKYINDRSAYNAIIENLKSYSCHVTKEQDGCEIPESEFRLVDDCSCPFGREVECIRGKKYDLQSRCKKAIPIDNPEDVNPETGKPYFSNLNPDKLTKMLPPDKPETKDEGNFRRALEMIFNVKEFGFQDTVVKEMKEIAREALSSPPASDSRDESNPQKWVHAFKDEQDFLQFFDQQNDAVYWQKRCEAAENLLAVMDAPKNKPDTANDAFVLFGERNQIWQKSKYPQP
jgi:hypothetical protein